MNNQKSARRQVRDWVVETFKAGLCYKMLILNFEYLIEDYSNHNLKSGKDGLFEGRLKLESKVTSQHYPQCPSNTTKEWLRSFKYLTSILGLVEFDFIDLIWMKLCWCVRITKLRNIYLIIIINLWQEWGKKAVRNFFNNPYHLSYTRILPSLGSPLI